ncbi:hypothetical protein E4U54_007502 [Claviceps lovelessii]|nr:hypothetical protein E4U54_007502 [Claviceps lovelessii]
MYSMKAAVVLGAAAAARAQLTTSTTSRFSNATTTADVVYTTEVVTAFTTYCPAATMIHIGNKTYTVTSATTLTITDCPCTVHKPVPTGPAGGADECAKKCNDQFDACQLAPDANHSFCASQLATCVGYNPFPNSGYKKPTACSAAPGPAPTQPAGGKDCAAKCVDAFNKCQVAPDANHSFCASQLATCVGYNPFGDGTFVTPTACSAAPATTAVQPTGSPDCAAKCVDAFNKCQVAPDANHSFCASQLATCVGYNPFGDGTFVTPTACSAGGVTPTGTAPTGTAPTGTAPTGTPPAVTAGAGHMSPALAMLALGAVALL